MNKLLYLALGVMAFACTQTNDENNNLTSAPAPVMDTAEYALSLDSAVIFTKRYDSLVSEILKTKTPIRAYTIRSADLLEALGLPEKTKVQYTHVRAYMGMDMNNNFRLFLTPVDGADLESLNPGKDVILSGPFTRGIKKGLGNNLQVDDGQYVMDFTAPCPNTCPPDSPLNQ